MSRHKRRSLKKVVTRVENHFVEDFMFALLISLVSVGIITLAFISAGLFVHFNNIITFFAFIFVSTLLVKISFGLGKSQGLYSAILSAFGYYIFYRVYSLIIFGNFWRHNPIVGDTFVNAVINSFLIYFAYLLFLYSHSVQKKHPKAF